MKLQTWLSLVCALAFLTITAGLAGAAPSFFGYTGLIRVPTADALSDNEFNAGAFFINRDELDDPDVYTGNLGVADDVEVGISVIRRGSGSDDVFVNGKYNFQPGADGKPALAAGIIDLASEVDATVYFVGSKGFGKVYETQFGPLHAGEFHVGFGGGQLDGIFGALNANLGPTAKLMLEYDTEDFNLGARFLVGRQFNIDVALFDWSDLGVGVSYTQGY
ncbi:MAG TPA: hypothetical protein VMY87_06870 [Armatimonadota bacterium]|nr:hypothetical protein [Armatimonadota bacterium]